MTDDRKNAVAAAFLAHHGDPEDNHLEEVSAAREAGAQRQAELFLSMLDAASAPKAARKPAPEVEDDSEDDDGA